MSSSDRRAEEPTTEQPKKKDRTALWMLLVIFAFIGQTAALYIPALVGQSPGDVELDQLPGRLLGSFLWPALMGFFIQKKRGKRKWVGAVLGLVAGYVIISGAYIVAAKNTGAGSSGAGAGAYTTEATNAWTQAEMTESYMRQLTKDQCMAKTINLLKTCDTQNCVNTMAGVVGDCVTWANGDLGEFCENYRERYIVTYCLSGELSRMGCAVVDTGRSVLCESG
ncbi:MAG: hypothetical protein HQ492_04015 [Woeseiaceae bacterium]|nr:hypothetical protein [Woeseiaceae bacterium]